MLFNDVKMYIDEGTNKPFKIKKIHLSSKQSYLKIENLFAMR
jgi:hypothetical protein